MKNDDKIMNFDDFKNENKESSAEFKKMIKNFMSAPQVSAIFDGFDDEYEPDDPYDYLELAEEAPNEREALKYAKKALELDKDCLDAEVMIAELSSNASHTLLEKYRKLLNKAKLRLEKEGFLDEDCFGEFWAILDTRPYMRLYSNYIHLLVDCRKMRKAVEECKEVLKLNEADNLGIRYVLMNLYAFLEDGESATELYKKYDEENSAMFLLPLSILYYKLDDLKEAEKYLKLLKKANKDTMKFFLAIDNGNLADDLYSASPYGYRPYTMDELMMEVRDFDFLFLSSGMYFEWAGKKIKSLK